MCQYISMLKKMKSRSMFFYLKLFFTQNLRLASLTKVGWNIKLTKNKNC